MLAPNDSSLAIFGTWAKPPDHVAQGALAVAVFFLLVALAPAGPRWAASFFDFASLDDLARRRRFLTVASFVAAFLSLGYLAYYLRGGPQLLEATAYFLEGRALSHGHLAFHLLDPSASFRSNLLLAHDGNVATPIFPPGFSLLLALCFWFGAPLLVGPLLAAAAAAATYFLAKELAVRALAGSTRDPAVESIARVAVALSLLCAALRYYTAETLPHAAVSTAIALALASALRARRTGENASFAIAGLAVGYVACTAPMSAVPVAGVVLALASKAERPARAIASSVALALPGIALLLLANRAQSGSAFVSGTSAYFAVSDGPPGCFRWGTGAGIGCIHQQIELAGGHAPLYFGPFDAVRATARALVLHAGDIANFEPLALLALVAIVGLRGKASGARAAFVVVAGVVVLQAPRFFSANAADDAAARARELADVLSVEHALVAIGLARILPKIAIARRALLVAALACAGFAVHSVHAHAAWRTDRPKFEPDVLRESNVKDGGFVFFDTPEGFNLAFVPDAEPSHQVVAARLRADDHDRLLYDLYGHPPSYKYNAPKLAPSTSASAEIEPASAPFWAPPLPNGGFGDETWRFESESDWPPLAQSNGWAHVIAPSPIDAPSCGAEPRALEILPMPTDAAEVTIELPLPAFADDTETARSWTLTPRVLIRGGGGQGEIDALDPSGALLATWSWNDDGQRGCRELASKAVAAEVPAAAHVAFGRLRLRARGGSVAVDRMNVRSERPAPRKSR